MMLEALSKAPRWTCTLLFDSESHMCIYYFVLQRKLWLYETKEFAQVIQLLIFRAGLWATGSVGVSL